jgi:hypothetical protein
MQALNAWLFGHDHGLMLTGPGDGDGVREPRRPVTPLQADAIALDPPFSP